MASESTPGACLMALRTALVQRRRQTAKTAWDAQGDRAISLAADLGAKLKAIQDSIDAVDKAILDEQIMEGTAPSDAADPAGA